MVERDADIVIARSDRASQPNKANPRGSTNLHLILARLRSAEKYQTMATALTSEMGAMEFEKAVGELASLGLINLRIDPS
jgi:hypothetical protein